LPDSTPICYYPTNSQRANKAYKECEKFANLLSFKCSPEWFFNETPLHQVYLSAFYIDKYEVTNAQYKTCVDASVCDIPEATVSATRSSYYNNSEFNEYPVVYINWNMAKGYCEWRRAQLPTEAQWEKAARGTDE
jgi:formylglycine-generating enzyme required for sulfatase activity